MENTVHRAVDVAPEPPDPAWRSSSHCWRSPAQRWPGTSLAGGLWLGLPLAAASLLGVRVRRSVAATVAIVIAGLALLQMLVWTTVSVVS